MGTKPHVIVIPFPAQGHVLPLLKLAYKLADHGIKVTFVNSDFIQGKITASMPEKFEENIPVSMVSISDGFSDNDRSDHHKVAESISSFMPRNLQNIIEDINRTNTDDEQVSCVIADVTAWWALRLAEKMGIKRAAVSPYALVNLVLQLQTPNLIEAGILNDDGIPVEVDRISVSKEISDWKASDLFWSMPGDPEEQKFIFQYFVKNTAETIKIANWVLVNSFHELEPSACDLVPDVLTVGPLFVNDKLGPFPGNFWPQDSTCLGWLDQQPLGSVIYAAFGSSAACNQQQFNELALGLEMLGRPLLWVVRSDFANGVVAEFPDGFMSRVANYGKIVAWAPQEKVLAHPSIACFFSHCGWNSTLEGLSNGVPFLCWPFYVDQFKNRNYICETWKIGLQLTTDENGIITRHEIKTKIEKLLSDKDIKANSLKLKEMARNSIDEGGSSFKNFKSFIEQIKQ